MIPSGRLLKPVPGNWFHISLLDRPRAHCSSRSGIGVSKGAFDVRPFHPPSCRRADDRRDAAGDAGGRRGLRPDLPPGVHRRCHRTRVSLRLSGTGHRHRLADDAARAPRLLLGRGRARGHDRRQQLPRRALVDRGRRSHHGGPHSPGEWHRPPAHAERPRSRRRAGRRRRSAAAVGLQHAVAQPLRAHGLPGA